MHVLSAVMVSLTLLSTSVIATPSDSLDITVVNSPVCKLFPWLCEGR